MTGKQKTAEPAAGFSEIEKTAMKDRAQELKAAKRGSGKATDEKAVLEKIAEMADSDRVLAEKLHALVAAKAPDLSPKLWYGMPGYAKDGHVVCFFQGAQKFKTRYSTLGFNEQAALDDGDMWPTAFALTTWTDAVEKRVGALIKQAVG